MKMQEDKGWIWARMLAYITGTVDQELLLRNECLAIENRILRDFVAHSLLTALRSPLRGQENIVREYEANINHV
jgi:hypothetical protein